MPRKQKMLLCIMLMSVMIFSATAVHADKPQDHPDKEKVELSAMQKRELAILHKDVLVKRKAIISKYVEYGVLTAEKGKKISSHLDQRYAKLEKHGFIIPHDKDWGKHSKKH